MEATGMRQRRVRHPWRGIVSGLIFGLGLGIMSIVYGINTLGDLTPWAALLIGLILGILLMFVPRPWGRSSAPPAAR
jgi:peptidoglycan/LPS O-acetylase OafA/YrhL